MRGIAQRAILGHLHTQLARKTVRRTNIYLWAMEAKDRAAAELMICVVIGGKRDRECGRINCGHWSLSALMWVMHRVRVIYGKKSGLLYAEAEEFCIPLDILKKKHRGLSDNAIT